MSKSTPGLHGVVEVKKPVVLDREERLRRSSSAMGALAVPLSMIDDLEAHLASVGANARVEWYPGTHHGFAFPQRPVYDKDAAEQHWERLLSLFDRNLR